MLCQTNLQLVRWSSFNTAKASLHRLQLCQGIHIHGVILSRVSATTTKKERNHSQIGFASPLTGCLLAALGTACDLRFKSVVKEEESKLHPSDEINLVME